MNEGMLEIIALNFILSLLYIFSLVKPAFIFMFTQWIDAQEKLQHDHRMELYTRFTRLKHAKLY